MRHAVLAALVLYAVTSAVTLPLVLLLGLFDTWWWLLTEGGGLVPALVSMAVFVAPIVRLISRLMPPGASEDASTC